MEVPKECKLTASCEDHKPSSLAPLGDSSNMAKSSELALLEAVSTTSMVGTTPAFPGAPLRLLSRDHQ